MNGFRISFPNELFGAMRYVILSSGNISPIVTVMSSLQTMLRLRNPGHPSYHNVANNCWQFGWATNWKILNTQWFYVSLQKLQLLGKTDNIFFVDSISNVYCILYFVSQWITLIKVYIFLSTDYQLKLKNEKEKKSFSKKTSWHFMHCALINKENILSTSVEELQQQLSLDIYLNDICCIESMISNINPVIMYLSPAM